MFFRNIVFAAIAAGILAGIILGTLQHFQITPIILGAEMYEITDEVKPQVTAEAHDHTNPTHHTPEKMAEHLAAIDAATNEHSAQTTESHSGGDHHHDPEAWSPEDGAERIFYTYLSSSLMAIGFALVIISGMSLSGKNSIKAGALWGLAGYISFFVAPTLGLPPEIPGMEAAALEGRQSWWLLTVLLTTIGLGLLAFGKGALRWSGLLVITIPHVLGAPQPAMHGFSHPDATAVAALEALVGQFEIATAIVNGIFWVCLGLLCAVAINTFFKLPEEETASST